MRRVVTRSPLIDNFEYFSGILNFSPCTKYEFQTMVLPKVRLIRFWSLVRVP